MWVQLRVCKQVEIFGEPTNLQPGDWAEIGKQQARLWLTCGDAVVPKRRSTFSIPNMAGVVVPSVTDSVTQALLPLGLSATEGEPSLEYGLTLIWNPKVPLTTEQLYNGFGLLDTWQIAAPLLDYEHLACHIGSDEERELTAEIIPDLRIPMYDSRVVFARRCAATQKLVSLWQGKGDHAFLRALYQTKPLILALPKLWRGDD